MKLFLPLFLSIVICAKLNAQALVMSHLIQDNKFSILVGLLKITELDQFLIDDDFYTGRNQFFKERCGLT